jgi:hypothetical protein
VQEQDIIRIHYYEQKVYGHKVGQQQQIKLNYEQRMVHLMKEIEIYIYENL